MKCVWFRSAHLGLQRWKSQGWRRKARATHHKSNTSPWRRSLSANAACCSNDRATKAAGTRTRDGPSFIIRSMTSASWLPKKSRLGNSRHRGRIDEEAARWGCWDMRKTPVFRSGSEEQVQKMTSRREKTRREHDWI